MWMAEPKVSLFQSNLVPRVPHTVILMASAHIPIPSGHNAMPDQCIF